MGVVRISMIAGSVGFLLGMVLGSFVKALADRSLGKKSFWGRSYCPKCRYKLAWYDLFPVFSFLILRGKCRYCHKKIGIEYLLVEVGMGLLVGFLFWQTVINFQFSVLNFQSIFSSQILNFIFDLVLKTFFIVILAIIFLTDLKKMFIPDRIIIPAIWIGVFSLLAITLYKSEVGLFFGSLLAGLLIGGFFLSLIVITGGKGMGGGDVKLGAFIGIMLGFPQAFFAIVLSFLTGAVFSVGLIAFGKKHFGQTIPFGPFLVLGSLIMVYWGQEIVDWYLKLGS